MYRPNSRSNGSVLVNLLVVGVITAGIFFAYNTFFGPDETEPASTVDTAAATVLPPTPVASPMVNATVAPTSGTSETTTAASQPVPAQDSSIFIPSVGVSAPIITAILRDNTWDISQLGTKVGYLQGTPWLGSGSNTVLSGHVEMSDGRTGVFATLDEMQVGDLITITDNGVAYTYIVREMRYVEPTDLTPLYPSTTDQLTLITCSDYNFFSDVYETRLVVFADRA